MIINGQQLKSALRAWEARGGSRADFDLAANILDLASCQADIRNGLTNPTYRQANPGGRDVWHISVGDALMLKYKLREYTDYAEVEIVP